MPKFQMKVKIFMIETDVNKYFDWVIDSETNFRKLNIHYPTVFEKEINKFKSYNGELKKCPHCNRQLPANTYFFAHGGKTRSDGLHGLCKECEGTHFGWGRIYNAELQEMELKYCATCDRVLPLNEFYFRKSKGKYNTKTGYSSNCKECNNTSFGLNSLNEYKDLFGIKEGFKICQTCFLELPNTTKYFFNRKERFYGSVRCKKCSIRHTDYGNKMPNVSRKEELKDDEAFCTKCHKIFPKSELTISKGYAQSMCSSCSKKSFQLTYEKRRNKRKKLIADLTLQEWEDTLEFFNNKCAYCGISDDESIEKYGKHLSQDHIVPVFNNGGYTKNNIIPACMGCNSSKNKLSLIQFFKKSEKFNQDRFQKILDFVNKFTLNEKEMIS